MTFFCGFLYLSLTKISYFSKCFPLPIQLWNLLWELTARYNRAAVFLYRRRIVLFHIIKNTRRFPLYKMSWDRKKTWKTDDSMVFCLCYIHFNNKGYVRSQFVSFSKTVCIFIYLVKMQALLSFSCCFWKDIIKMSVATNRSFVFFGAAGFGLPHFFVLRGGRWEYYQIKSIIEQFGSPDCKAFFLQIKNPFHRQPINCHEIDVQSDETKI